MFTKAQKQLRSAHGMPTVLFVLYGFLALLPLWSIYQVGWPQESFDAGDFLQGYFLLIVYWISPICLLLALHYQSFFAIPFWVVLCFGLIAQNFTDPNLGGTSLLALQLMLIVTMFILGLMLMQKDIIYPLISRSGRGWRRAPRIKINAKAEIQFSGGETIKGMVQDASVHGLGILFNGDDEEMELMKKYAMTQDEMKLRLRFDGKWFAIGGVIRRLHLDGSVGIVGLESDDDMVLANMIGKTTRQTEGGFWEKYWITPRLRRTLMVVWVLSFLGTFLIPNLSLGAAPAYGTVDQADR